MNRPPRKARSSTATDVTAGAPGAPALAPRWTLFLPWLLIAIAVVLERATPPSYTFATLPAGAAPLAAMVYRPGMTAVTGVAVVAATVLLDQRSGTPTEHDWIDATSLGSVALLSVLASVLRMRAQRRLSRVRAVAEAAQMALLRPMPPRLGPVRMAAAYRAADTEALVGGDLYGARATPYGVRVIVGDVRGKGTKAVATVATVLAAFREAAMVHEELTAVAERIEQALRYETEAVGDAELFVTAVLLEFPEHEPVVRVLDRGHTALLVLDENGVRTLDAPDGLPLGLAALAPGPAGQQVTEELGPGRLLLACSDGVTEARDRAGVFYPLPDRLAGHFGTDPVPSPGEATTFVAQDVNDWAPWLADDMVVVALGRADEGGETAAP
ncbi:PP2C family protein-serine/threonine phosphatase [Streptomyces sp. NPDC002851]